MLNQVLPCANKKFQNKYTFKIGHKGLEAKSIK